METSISDMIAQKMFYQCLDKISGEEFGKRFGDKEKVAFEKCCEMYTVAYKISAGEYFNYLRKMSGGGN